MLNSGAHGPLGGILGVCPGFVFILRPGHRRRSSTLTSDSTHASLKKPQGFCRPPLPHHTPGPPHLGQGPLGSSPNDLWGSWSKLPLPLPFALPGSQIYCDSCSAERGLGRAQEFLRKDWEWLEPHLSRAPSVLHTCPARPIPSPTIPLPFCCPDHHLLISGTCHSPVHRSPFFSPPNLLPTWPGLLFPS